MWGLGEGRSVRVWGLVEEWNMRVWGLGEEWSRRVQAMWKGRSGKEQRLEKGRRGIGWGLGELIQNNVVQSIKLQRSVWHQLPHPHPVVQNVVWALVNMWWHPFCYGFKKDTGKAI